MNYEWGLETTTNNQAEAYAVLQGIKLANPTIVNSVIAIGDSAIIISFMNNNKALTDGQLARLITRIKKESLCSEDIKCFHVLRDLKKEADMNASRASRLNE